MNNLKLNNILKQAPYLTKQNLALALSKEGESLNYWIKKLLKEKALISLKKGFYISSYYLDLVSQNPLNKEAYFEYLANFLRFPSYISLEYVLSSRNFLAETAFAITSVTVKSPRVYESEITKFVYRSIKQELFSGYGFKEFGIKSIKIASLPKAFFDFVYLKKFATVEEMREYLTEGGRFNWDVMLPNDKKELVQLTEVSGSKKMKLVLSILRKAKIL